MIHNQGINLIINTYYINHFINNRSLYDISFYLRIYLRYHKSNLR